MALVAIGLPVPAQAAVGVSAFWTGAFYAFCMLTIAFALLMVVVLKQPRWLPYCLLAALTTLFVATSEGTLGQLLGATDTFRHVTQLFLGICLCGLGFLTIADQIDPDHPYRRLKQPFRVLGWLVLLMIPGLYVTSIYNLYLVLNLLMLCMFVCQVIPVLTWRSLPRPQQRLALLTAVLLALCICSYYIGYFSGWQFALEHLDLANRAFFILFLLLSIGFWGLHVLAIEDSRIQALTSAVSAANAEAETNQALFQAELEYTRARQVATQRGQQLAAASHDLRQPLASLRTTLDVLVQNQSSEVSSRVREAVNYVDQLAAGISADPSPLTEDETSAELEVVQAAVLLDNLQRMFAADAAAAGIRFHMVHCSAEVLVPPLVCMRILSNLVVNAITHAGATKILLGARRRGERLLLQVLDNGVGLSPEDPQLLLASGAKGQNSPGLGLGLAIVVDLCARHALELQVASEVGRGSNFSLLVPRATKLAR